MNEIERAIGSLEMLRALMLFDTMTGEDIPLDTLNRDNRDLYDAAKVALIALREQAERNKGCEYCKTPFKTMLKFDLGIYGNGDTAELYVETDGQNIRAYDNDPRNPQIESSPIRFCPICGRPLKDGEKHE